MSTPVTVGLLVALAALLAWWPALPPRHLGARCDGAVAGGVPGRGGALSIPPVRGWRGAGRDDGEIQVLALAESLAAALASGLEVTAAHAVVVASAPPGSEVVDLLRLRGDETASAAWGRAGASSPAARAVGRALSVSERLGSPARDAVVVAVASGRERFEQAGAVSGAVAGARATARLLTALPLAGPLAVAGLGLDPLETYLAVPAAASALAGLGLTWVGHRWVARQVRRASREQVAA